MIKQTTATWGLSLTLLRGWPVTHRHCWVCIWPDCLNNLYAIEVLRVIQLSNDTCNSPWSSCFWGVFPYLVCAYVLSWSNWSKQGHSIVQWHLQQSPELLFSGCFSLFGMWLCALLIQLKLAGSFNCPMTLAIIPEALVLGVFSLIWYVLPLSSWSTRGHSIVQWHMRQYLELLPWGCFSLFGICFFKPVNVFNII